jgi:RHS repeat-associated protein
VLAEYNGSSGTLIRNNVYSGSRMIAKVEGGVTSYYLSDRLSTRLVLDSSGNMTSRQAHLPYGEEIGSSGATEKHRFTSYERDSETGLDYAINRSYSSSVGRFSQADPYRASGFMRDPQSWNRYSYTRNDAVNAVDPLGLADEPANNIPIAPIDGGRLGQVTIKPKEDPLQNEFILDILRTLETMRQIWVSLLRQMAKAAELAESLQEEIQLRELKKIACQEDITKAIDQAYTSAGSGSLNIERGFLVVRASGNVLQPLGVTGDKPGRWEPEGGIIPGNAVALFHTHRDLKEARPSPDDINAANNFKVVHFVIHTNGLYAYIPPHNKLNLKAGPRRVLSSRNWTEECKK